MKLSPLRLSLLAALGGLLLAALSEGALAGKPTPPPAPLPPIRYTLTLLGSLGGSTEPKAMNNAGIVVGRAFDAADVSHAFVWTAATGLVNLNDVAAVPAGWRLLSARGINAAGQVAGTAENLETGQRRAYRYDPTGTITLVPVTGPENYSAALNRAINDRGDVAYYALLGDGYHTFVLTAEGQLIDELVPGGVNAMNDMGQMVGFPDAGGYRLTLNPDGAPGTIELFPSLSSPEDINNSGHFVGRYGTASKGGTLWQPMRYRSSVEVLHSSSGYSQGLNSDDDVCGNYYPSKTLGRRGFLYMDDYGLVNLDSLVVGNAADVAIWKDADYVYPQAIGERDGTGFGAMCASVIPVGFVSPTLGYLLTPVPVP